MEGRMLIELCLIKELYVSNTWFNREEKRKVTFRIGENGKKIVFVLLKIENRRFIHNVNAITRESQHVLVVADIDKKIIRNVVRKTCIGRRKRCLLKDVKIRKRFEENVITLVDIGAPNL